VKTKVFFLTVNSTKGTVTNKEDYKKITKKKTKKRPPTKKRKKENKEKNLVHKKM